MNTRTQNHNVKVELVQPEPKQTEKYEGIWGKALKVAGLAALVTAACVGGYKAYEHFVEDADIVVEEV